MIKEQPKLPSLFTQFDEELLQKMNSIFWNYQNSKFSYPQLSHRSKYYVDVTQKAQRLIKEYFEVSESYEVIFVSNGAQYSGIPFNLTSLVQGNSLYLANNEESQFAYKESLKINPQTLLIKEQSQRKKLSQAKKKFYTYYQKISIENGKQNPELTPYENQILICNLNYCSHYEKVDINTHGITFFESGHGYGLTGMCVMMVRKDLIGYELQTCPDVMSFSFGVRAKSVINTPFTLVPLTLAEYTQKQITEKKSHSIVKQQIKLIKEEFIKVLLEKKTQVEETSVVSLIKIKCCEKDLTEKGVENLLKTKEGFIINLQKTNRNAYKAFIESYFK